MQPESSPAAAPMPAEDHDDDLAQLRDTLASQTEYVGVVGHELRNSVAPLVLLIQQLDDRAREEACPPPWMADQLARIHKQLGHVVESIETISDVARLSEGRFELDPAPVDLADVARQVVAELAPEATAGGARISLDAPHAVVGHWDRGRLEQILGHLLSNAIRYAGGEIEVRLTASVDRAELTVVDHGSGIDPRDHARLFERFERVGRRRAGRFGIGLWVVKTLCVAMGGTVAVASAPGAGARFTAALPRA
ncbi:MAG: HAMP domain-containing sensor histidine kinase [Kofleriaceae bacterium]